MQELVHQEQDRQRAAGLVQNLAQAQDFGVEARDAFLQGIRHLDRSAHCQRRDSQRLGAHRRTRLRQHGVDAERPQQGAFAGHVRAADHQHAQLSADPDVVAHHAIFGDQRVPDLAGFEQGAGFGELRERIGGVLEGMARKGAERFDFAHGRDPAAHGAAGVPAPVLGPDGVVRSPQDEGLQHADENVIARIDVLDDPPQAA